MLALAALLLIAADPPTHSALVDATSVVPHLRLDLRYATAHNLVGEVLYAHASCLLLPQTAQALARAEATLEAHGFALVAWDCFRPRRVQRELWKKQPTPGLVANPTRGSNHNRGAAVDVALVQLDGGAVALPTDFDDLSPKAAANASDELSDEAKRNRATLQAAMRGAGFTTIRKEWWHFDLKGALQLPVLDDEL